METLSTTEYKNDHKKTAEPTLHTTTAMMAAMAAIRAVGSVQKRSKHREIDEMEV